MVGPTLLLLTFQSVPTELAATAQEGSTEVLSASVIYVEASRHQSFAPLVFQPLTQPRDNIRHGGFYPAASLSHWYLNGDQGRWPPSVLHIAYLPVWHTKFHRSFSHLLCRSFFVVAKESFVRPSGLSTFVDCSSLLSPTLLSSARDLGSHYED